MLVMKHIVYTIPKSYILEPMIPPFCTICNKYINLSRCNQKNIPNDCPFIESNYKPTKNHNNHAKHNYK